MNFRNIAPDLHQYIKQNSASHVNDSVKLVKNSGNYFYINSFLSVNFNIFAS